MADIEVKDQPAAAAEEVPAAASDAATETADGEEKISKR